MVAHADDGSSPRAWGRLLAMYREIKPGRFIPTCVGQMRCWRSGPSGRARFIPTCVGQIACEILLACIEERFIPTCVGQIMPVSLVAHSVTVHPHVRGADSVPATAVQMCVGSSPRAWGRCSALESASVMLLGSSPRAWGRSPPGRAAAGLYAVHPHVRGADVFPYDSLVRPTRFIPTCVGQMVFRCAFSLTDHGSSPRAWGRYAARVRRLRRGRFIPTCVGQMANEAAKTIAQFGSSPRAWGRFCSAKLAYAPFPVHPHVRGADGVCGDELVDHLRFIPTCVGQMAKIQTTLCISPGSSPRAWGRSLISVLLRRLPDGSSPRAWGRCQCAF